MTKKPTSWAKEEEPYKNPEGADKIWYNKKKNDPQDIVDNTSWIQVRKKDIYTSPRKTISQTKLNKNKKRVKIKMIEN